MPEVKPIIWRKDCQTFRATPLCRTCAEKYQDSIQIPYGLHAFCNSNFTCGLGKCEYPAAYLAIY